MPQTENGLDTELIARSGWTAYRAAMQLPLIPWEHASDEEEARWQRVALHAEGLLLTLQGQRFDQIAPVLARSYWRDERPLTSAETLAWEAAARHLATLLDADEIPEDLAKQEQSWAEWAQKRLLKENP